MNEPPLNPAQRVAARSLKLDDALAAALAAPCPERLVKAARQAAKLVDDLLALASAADLPR